MIRRTRLLIELLVVFSAMMATARAADTARFPASTGFRSPDGKLLVRDVVEAEDERGVRHALVLQDAATKKEMNRISYMGTAEVRWSPDSRRILATFYSESGEGYIAIVTANIRDGGQTGFDPEMMGGLLPAHERRFNDNEHVSIEAEGFKGNDAVVFSVHGRGHHDPNGFRMSCTWTISNSELDCHLLRSKDLLRSKE